MTGVVIPDPRGGLVWIHGVDGSGNPVKVLVHIDGSVKVKSIADAVTVQAAGGDKVFSFESAVMGRVESWSLSAGTNQLDSSVVPDGKCWILTNIAMEYIGTPPTEIMFKLRLGVDNYELWNVLAPVSNRWYDRQGWWLLEESARLRVTVVGATLADVARYCYTGFELNAT